MKNGILLKLGIPVLVTAGAATGAYFYFHTGTMAKKVVHFEQGGFSGVIVDGETNRPLAGALVTAHPYNRHIPDRLCESDSSGRFGFELQDARYLVTASYPEYTSRGLNDTGREIQIAEHTSFVNAKLKLWPCASVQGKIKAGNTGIPAKIVFTYVRDASGAENYEFQNMNADADGSFLIACAPAGVMSVSVTADGFASVDLNDILLKAGQNVDLGDIPLRDGVSLFGQITDASAKRAIRGANIVVKNTSHDIIAKSVSDEKGNYRLPPLDMMLITLDIAAEGYHPVSQKMALKGNANREFDVMLHRAWGLSLNVQNQTEREPLKTVIKITDVVSGKLVYDETLENGNYSIDSLKGGPFLIEAASMDTFTKTSMRASTGDSVYIRLKPFGKIILKALDSDGSPLSGGEFRYLYRAESTDSFMDKPWHEIASTELEIPDLHEGYYTVEIRKDKEKTASSHEFRVTHGDVRTVSVQLTEGGVLSGRVVTTEGNSLRADVTLVNDGRSVQTDRDGYFTIDKMPVSEATVIITPKGKNSEPTTFEHIVVKENAKLERDFQIYSPKADERAERRAKIHEMRERGEIPDFQGPPPWGDGKPPWGDGQPPWGDGKPPWGDGQPPWGDGQPPWGDGKPPWGDGQPPWGDGQPPQLPDFGNGQRPQPQESGFNHRNDNN